MVSVFCLQSPTHRTWTNGMHAEASIHAVCEMAMVAGGIYIRILHVRLVREDIPETFRYMCVGNIRERWKARG